MQKYASLLRAPRRLRQRGFTLIEALVVLTIAFVLLAAGLPSFRSLMAGRAISSHVQAFGDSVRFARSEALKRGVPVTMCASTGPMNDTPTCWDLGAGASYDWKVGWVVFVDRNADRVVDASDIVLRREQGLRSSGEALSTSRALTFQTNGLSIGGGMQIDFRPESAGDRTALQKIACLSSIGRITLIPSGTCP